jgi:hypothetical protein
MISSFQVSGLILMRWFKYKKASEEGDERSQTFWFLVMGCNHLFIPAAILIFSQNFFVEPTA